MSLYFPVVMQSTQRLFSEAAVSFHNGQVIEEGRFQFQQKDGRQVRVSVLPACSCFITCHGSQKSSNETLSLHRTTQLLTVYLLHLLHSP